MIAGNFCISFFVCHLKLLYMHSFLYSNLIIENMFDKVLGFREIYSFIMLKECCVFES